jgi:hypothetical protein
LVELAADLGLALLIPPGTVTYPNAQMAIDLVWGSQAAVTSLLKCQIAENNDQGSDHLSVKMHLQVIGKPIPEEPKFNFANANWDKYHNALVRHISPPTTDSLSSPQAIDKATSKLVNAIQGALKESIPMKCPSQHSKQWWSKQLTIL